MLAAKASLNQFVDEQLNRLAQTQQDAVEQPAADPQSARGVLEDAHAVFLRQGAQGLVLLVTPHAGLGLAVHPTDPNTVFAATENGRCFLDWAHRVQAEIVRQSL